MSTKLMEKTATEAAERDIATHKVLMEDDSMVVTHWVFKPGEQTGWHRHELDYVVIYESEGTLTSHFADGSTKEFAYAPGKSASIKAPVEHNAVNTGTTDIMGYEIEYKS